LVFGFIGNNGGQPVYTITFEKGTDSSNALFDSYLPVKTLESSATHPMPNWKKI
jgi:hypothetical protein